VIAPRRSQSLANYIPRIFNKKSVIPQNLVLLRATPLAVRTPAQINASRVNGAKSILLKSESVADFEEFSHAFYDEFQPQTAFEVMLLENMIAARWRQMRVCVMEQALTSHETARREQAALLHREITESETAQTAPQENAAPETSATAVALAIHELAGESRTLDLMRRCELGYDRQFLRSHRRLLEVQDRRRTPPPTPVRPRLAPVIPIRTNPESAAAKK
jgi:hypothetical protein